MPPRLITAPLRSFARAGIACAKQTRSIAQTHLAKVADGEERWAARAERIEKGEEKHMWDILEERGYLKDVAGYGLLH